MFVIYYNFTSTRFCSIHCFKIKESIKLLQFKNELKEIYLTIY